MIQWVAALYKYTTRDTALTFTWQKFRCLDFDSRQDILPFCCSTVLYIHCMFSGKMYTHPHVRKHTYNKIKHMLQIVLIIEPFVLKIHSNYSNIRGWKNSRGLNKIKYICPSKTQISSLAGKLLVSFSIAERKFVVTSHPIDISHVQCTCKYDRDVEWVNASDAWKSV